MTFARAKQHLNDLGMSIAKRDGEYRVNFRVGGNEDSAYYTDDLFVTGTL